MIKNTSESETEEFKRLFGDGSRKYEIRFRMDGTITWLDTKDSEIITWFTSKGGVELTR